MVERRCDKEMTRADDIGREGVAVPSRAMLDGCRVKQCQCYLTIGPSNEQQESGRKALVSSLARARQDTGSLRTSTYLYIR